MRPIIRQLGLVDYLTTWQAMQQFTDQRHANTPDELWVLEHPPVYTLGMVGKTEHLLRDNGIPVVQCDRGGQVTYHGPGQLVVYLLIDLKRQGIGVRDLVRCMEQSIIDILANYNIVAHGDIHAPGVYVGSEKIASLGLRVKRGATYHGLGLNISLDLCPFRDINPCGYAGLVVTRMNDLLSVPVNTDDIAEQLIPLLEKNIFKSS